MSEIHSFTKQHKSNVVEILKKVPATMNDIQSIDLTGDTGLQNQLCPTHQDWIYKILGINVLFYKLPNDIPADRFLFGFNGTMYVSKKKLKIENIKMDSNTVYILTSSVFIPQSKVNSLSIQVCREFGIDIEWILKFIIPNGVYTVGDSFSFRDRVIHNFSIGKKSPINISANDDIFTFNRELREHKNMCQLCGAVSKLEVNAISTSNGLVFIPMCPRCKSYLIHGLRSTIASRKSMSLDIGLIDSHGTIEDYNIMLGYSSSIVSCTKHFREYYKAQGAIQREI